jgi:hypothetical protein
VRQRTISATEIAASTRDRFWNKVSRQDSESCWVWNGAQFRKGYGNFYIPSIGNIGAHIVAYLLAHPSELLNPDDCVLHGCDNPPCCNARHLFKGSKKDNTRDMMKKGRAKFAHNIEFARGRQPKGEDHSHAKLTEADVIAIRTARANGIGQKVLARLYGVRYQTIQAIDHKRSWSHLEQPRTEPDQRTLFDPTK